MSLGAYPPGVTGNEYPIAGPDSEVPAERRCPTHEDFEPGVIVTYGRSRWWSSDVCDEIVELPLDGEEVA